VADSGPANRAPRTGTVARSAIAGLAAARIGVAKLSHNALSLGLRRTEEQQALAQTEHDASLGRILFSSLNQLKGTALKASQLLSLELGLLPDSLRQELARAHYQVTPLNRALVIKLLRQDLGKGPDTLFQQFNPIAFAAASLGQVHAAVTLDGQAVAVKLQYPGMAESMDSDMRLVRGLLHTFRGQSTLLPDATLVDQALTDIAVTLKDELDYHKEAQQLSWFSGHLGSPDWVVPLVYPSLSSRRVLAMQHLQGLHLNEWLGSNPSQTQRNRYGQLLFDHFLHCVFQLNRLQADPHPGNFLFMDDGRLGLLDFGCTRQPSPLFCEVTQTTWRRRSSPAEESRHMHQHYQALGMLSPTFTQQEFATQVWPALADFHAWQRLPFGFSEYDFSTHPAPPRANTQAHREASRHLAGLHADLPYFDRAFLGLVQLLRQLGARIQITNRWTHEEQS
jgi:predicted unusual protein kinase regulating ubiquinone biosynthesis (AarF/ABC1/UbiB family)